MAITYEFLTRNGGGVDVIASVTNDAGAVTWSGDPVVIESIQRMVAEFGFDVSDPAQLEALRDRLSFGSYFTCAPAPTPGQQS